MVKSTTARRRIISSPGVQPVKMPVSSTGLGDPATLLPQRETTERARRVGALWSGFWVCNLWPSMRVKTHTLNTDYEGEWLDVVWRREWEIM
jgi:hypothetical protein